MPNSMTLYVAATTAILASLGAAGCDRPGAVTQTGAAETDVTPMDVKDGPDDDGGTTRVFYE